MGFVVQRVYEAVDDPEDVRQDADGAWHIKAGARVRVHLTMVADNRRYHVALVDPLPAGLEIVNPALAVSRQRCPQDPTSPEYRRFWWWGPWYEHQNLRDERAEAFTTLLWDGVYQYTLYRPRHHARHVRRPTRQGRGNVLARGLWPQRQRHRDRGIGQTFSKREMAMPGGTFSAAGHRHLAENFSLVRCRNLQNKAIMG